VGGVWENDKIGILGRIRGRSTDLSVVCDTDGGYATINFDIFVGLIVFKPIRDCKEKTSDGQGERNVQAHLTQ
jgi:hypothetical protein